MLRCPFCDADLSDERLRSGRCPSCGSVLAWDEPAEDAAVADVVPAESPRSLVAALHAATVIEPPGRPEAPNSTAPDAAAPRVPEAGRSSPAAAEPMATGSQPEAPPPASPASTLTSPDISRTIAPRELSPEEQRQVTHLWGGDDVPPANAGMTLKGAALTAAPANDKTATGPGSVLVIRPRAVKPAPVSDRSADYELLEVIGEGGVGVVYAARQASIDRTVAVKVLKPDLTDNLDQREKFLSEAIVTGELDHPNIVPIHDLGSNEAGALFYSMKHVQGTPWLTVLREKPLSENLSILMKVADAVAFAHARGVIHRDLKPENVMLGDFGEVLVMDWGIAIPTPDFRKAGSITQSLSMGGTPAYMAPEMVTGPFERIGFASDVYLLGAMLYEVITGRPPHTGHDVMACLYAAARNEIQPTGQSGELLNIALTAMATRPEDRYAGVQEFQAAIREYESHSESILLTERAEEELEQGRQSGNYQDFSRAVFAFEEALALWDQNAKARTGRSVAKQAYARTALKKGDYDLGVSLLDADDPEHAPLRKKLLAGQAERDARQQRLAQARRLTRGMLVLLFLVVTFASVFSWGEMRKAHVARKQQEVAADEAKRAEQVAQKQRIRAEGLHAEAVEARDGLSQSLLREEAERQVAVRARDDAVRAQKLAMQAKEQEAYEAYVAQIALASEKIDDNAFDDARRLLEAYATSPLRHWEWGRLWFLCERHVARLDVGTLVDAVAFDPQGGRFVTAGRDSRLRVWDADSLEETLAPIPLESETVSVAWSPDGRYLAAGGDDRMVGVWNAHDGTPLWTSRRHEGAVTSVAFSHNGRWLVSTSFDRTARLWDVVSGAELQVLREHSWWVWAAAFMPGDDRLATAGQDGRVVVWSLATSGGRPQARVFKTFSEHSGPVYAVAWSPDGRQVASGGHDRQILLWNPDEVEAIDLGRRLRGEPDPPSRARILEGHRGAVRSLDFAAGAETALLLSGGDDNTLCLWDAGSGELIRPLRGHGGNVRSCAFAPQPAAGKGRRVISASHDHSVRLWDVAGYEEARVFQARRLRGHDDAVLGAAFDPTGERIVTASRDRTARVWDVASGRETQVLQEGHEFLVSAARFFPDGTHLATSAFDNTTRLWDVRSGAQVARLDGTGPEAALALSPDGRWILTGSDDTTAKLWRTADLLPVGRTSQSVQTMPDGLGSLSEQPVAEKTPNESVQTRSDGLVSPSDKSPEPRRLVGHEARVSAAAISSDSRLLFTGDKQGRGALWNAETGERLRWVSGPGGRGGHAGEITAAHFLPDGRRLLTASHDTTVSQWDASSGTEQTDLVLRHPDSVIALDVSPDGRQALTVCVVSENDTERNSIVSLWDVQTARRVRTMTVRNETVNSVAFSPDRRRAVTASSNDTVRLWDLATGSELGPQAHGPRPVGVQRGAQQAWGEFGPRGVTVWTARFSPDGAFVLTAGGNNARLWDLHTRQERMSFSPHRAVASAGFSPDGAYLVTGSWDNSAKIWNLTGAERGRVAVKLMGEHAGPVNTAVFCPVDPRRVLTASDDGTARLWHWEPEAHRLSGKGDWLPDVVIDVASDHEGEGACPLFRTADEATQVLRVFRHRRGAVLAAAFSADGTRILTASDDRTACLWDSEDDSEPLHVLRHDSPVLCAAFSADGTRVVTGTEDRTARLWNARTGEEIRLPNPLRGHTAAVTSVAFSPDGERLLTGSQDTNVTLWDATTGKEIITLRGHTQEVTSVAFSPDGRSALTSSRDGTAILWLAAPLPAVAGDLAPNSTHPRHSSGRFSDLAD